MLYVAKVKEIKWFLVPNDTEMDLMTFKWFRNFEEIQVIFGIFDSLKFQWLIDVKMVKYINN